MKKVLTLLLVIIILAIGCRLRFGNIGNTVDVSLDTSDEATRNMTSAMTTGTILETTAVHMKLDKSRFSVRVKGFDISRLTTDNSKGKIKVLVNNVSGIKYAEAGTNSAVYESSVAGNVNPVDLDALGFIPTSTFDVAVGRANSIELMANDTLLERIRSKIVFVGDVGLLKVTLEFYDNNLEKLSSIADVYLVVKRTS